MIQYATFKENKEIKKKKMTDYPNPYGRPSFYDLDTTWYEYMKADRKERKQMCEDAIHIEALVVGLCFLVVVVLVIVALCKGWV